MIITPPAVLHAFLSGLGILIGVALLVVWAKGIGPGDERADELELRLARSLALATALVAIHLASWPLFYSALVSYVPLTPGAMCVYGVTKVAPSLSGLVEILEPVSLAAAGTALITLAGYRSGSILCPARRVIRHVAFAGLLSTLASGAGLVFDLYPKGGREVTCCGMVFSSPTRFTAQTAGLFLGSEAGRLLLPVALGLAILLLACQLRIVLRPSGGRWRIGAACALALVHVVAAVLALFETIAPVLLGWANHHCAYCLVSPRHWPSLGIFGMLLLGLSTLVPLWFFWGNRVELLDGDRKTGRGWLVCSILSLVAFWALVLVPFLRADAPGL